MEELNALPCVNELASAHNVPGVIGNCFYLSKLHETEKNALVPLLQCDTVAFRLLGLEVKERFLDADANRCWITESTAAGMTGLPYGDHNIDTIMMWQRSTLGNEVCGVIADFKMFNALHATDDEYVIVFGNGGWNPMSSLLMEIVGDHREAFRSFARMAFQQASAALARASTLGLVMSFPSTTEHPGRRGNMGIMHRWSSSQQSTSSS